MLEIPTGLLLEARSRNRALAALDLEGELERLEHEWVRSTGAYESISNATRSTRRRRHSSSSTASAITLAGTWGWRPRSPRAGTTRCWSTAAGTGSRRAGAGTPRSRTTSGGRAGDRARPLALRRAGDPARGLARRDHRLVPAHPRAGHRRGGLSLHRPPRRRPRSVGRAARPAPARARPHRPASARPRAADRRLRAGGARPEDESLLRRAPGPAVQLHGSAPALPRATPPFGPASRGSGSRPPCSS